MTAWYNEPDPVAAEWLRRLIDHGAIAPGVVDERDIRDVAPDELVQFTQCHFFAGIGIWSAALTRAGWPDDRPIWTGSCPCQPFSKAGRGDAFDDERHLWPAWFWHIQHGRPRAIVGEQVAGQDGLGWNDLVSADLVGIDYAFGAIITCVAGHGVDWRGSPESERLERAIRLCPDPVAGRHLDSFARWADQALGIGGFHIRERQYFVGLPDAVGEHAERIARQGARPGEASSRRSYRPPSGRSDAGWIPDADGARLFPGSHPGIRGEKEGRRPRHGQFERHGPHGWLDNVERDRRRARGNRDHAGNERIESDSDVAALGLVDRECSGLEGLRGHGADRDEPGRVGTVPDGPVAKAGSPRILRASADYGQGGDIDWLLCTDGFWRPTQSDIFPLANASPGRVGALRGYGNGLDFETAVAVCEALIEMMGELD